jgi:ketosteroid isomerase-like protein
MTTEDVIHRFNQAFLNHEPAALTELISPDCVVERSQATAQGWHIVGGAACLAAWQALAANRTARFELEDVLVMGELGLIFWTYHTGPNPGDVSRGLNVMRVRGGQIVEGRGYVKSKP